MMIQANDFVNFFTNPFFLIAVTFWGIIALLILVLGHFKKSKALSVFFPFLAMVKTTRLNKLLRKIALKSPRTWKVIFTIGIFISFFFTIYGFWYFTSNLINLLLPVFFPSSYKPSPEAQVTPLVPGLTIDFNTFTYLIIPILLVLTVHEFSHAISANADDIPVKSTGVLGMGVFFIIGFGAFVEIDEKAYKRGHYSGWQKSRMAAAGSFSNAFLALIALILVLNFPSVVSLTWGPPNALSITNVYTSAQGGYNQGTLQSGDVLFAINGKTLASLDLNLSAYLVHVHPGDVILCTIMRNGVNQTIAVRTGTPPAGTENQSMAFIGIQLEPWWPPRNWFGNWLGGLFPNTLQIEIFWLWTISISVTIFNMLPVPIFDGDKVVYELINHFIKPRKIKRGVKERFIIGKDSKTYELARLSAEGEHSVIMLPNPKYPDSHAFELAEHQDYQFTDSDGDDRLDHVTFELSDKDLVGKMVEIEYIAEVDSKEGQKRVIMNFIRVISLALILLNFIISALTLGFKLPFG
ncbi:MAG TPA: site-2 protease family protein [Candidatus Lokiarchaeia archaeon]|nr:site-2 protease family protein [Candidatus Lokiarchaeia archaeon]